MKVFEDFEEGEVQEDRNVAGWTFVNNAEQSILEAAEKLNSKK